jgi:hypothetical protein
MHFPASAKDRARRIGQGSGGDTGSRCEQLLCGNATVMTAPFEEIP